MSVHKGVENNIQGKPNGDKSANKRANISHEGDYRYTIPNYTRCKLLVLLLHIIPADVSQRGLDYEAEL